MSLSTIQHWVTHQATVAEKRLFQDLWAVSLNQREKGKVIYYLPSGIGREFGMSVLRGFADTLSLEIGTDIWIHLNNDDTHYRVGQIIDYDDQFELLNFKALYLGSYVKLIAFRGAQAAVPTAALTSSTEPSTPELPRTPTTSAARRRPVRSPRSPAKKEEKIPKPRNSWIIYRQHHHATVLAANPGMHTSRLSTIIADMWRNANSAVKAEFKKMAEDEKAEHQRKYPNYKCEPRKSSEIKKRKGSKFSKNDKVTVSGSNITIAQTPSVSLAMSFNNNTSTSDHQTLAYGFGSTSEDTLDAEAEWQHDFEVDFLADIAAIDAAANDLFDLQSWEVPTL